MYLNRGMSLNLLILVPEAGIEPACAFWARGILSPLRLPISPLRQQGPQWRDSSIGVYVGQGRLIGAQSFARIVIVGETCATGSTHKDNIFDQSHFSRMSHESHANHGIRFTRNVVWP